MQNVAPITIFDIEGDWAIETKRRCLAESVNVRRIRSPPQLPDLVYDGLSGSRESSSPLDSSENRPNRDLPHAEVAKDNPKVQSQCEDNSHAQSSTFPSPDHPKYHCILHVESKSCRGLNSKSRSSSAPEIGNTGPNGVPSPEPEMRILERKNEFRDIIENTNDVFDVMKEKIDKTHPDTGRIYILRNIEYPGFVKIGRTTKPIRKRQNQINRCIEQKLEVISGDDHSCIPNHQRVERVIHKELWNYERHFACRSCKRKRQRCEDNDGTSVHSEWFEIPEAKAIEVVDRWRKWISTNPYCDGQLKQKELLRIEAYASNPALMHGMVIQDEWHWQAFMQTSRFYFHFLWLRHLLCAKRSAGKTDCSRLESLSKHWKSNIIFALLIFVVSVILSTIPSLFPVSLPAYAGMNMVVFGAGGILYAA